jgi:hypothetical protein
MTIPSTARTPSDHKPKAKKKPPKTAAILLAPDPRFEVINDGDDLLYHSKRNGDINFPLDIPLEVLADVIALDGNVEDPRDVIELLKSLIGPDVMKLGTRELMPVFERWSAQLGQAMGGQPGESSSSPA